VKIIRVSYGRKDTPEHMREYRIDGVGPVGTISEFEKHFPDEEFEIVDTVIQDGYETSN